MAFSNSFDIGRPQPSLAEKLWSINWGLVLLLTILAGIGFATLYSAANGSWQPWARQAGDALRRVAGRHAGRGHDRHPLLAPIPLRLHLLRRCRWCC